MIELIDNTISFLATAVSCVWAGATFSKKRRQPFFLLACFYGTFSLGTLYWTLHLLLFDETPPLFYVSDIGWVASYIFLLVLLYTLRAPAQRQQKTALCWLAPALCIPQFVLYITHGDLLFNLLMCIPTMLIAWLAIQGLVFSLRSSEEKTNAPFYISALCFVALEYCLWTSSCFWLGDTLANPYFWFDLLLSASMLSLLPALQKAVIQ